MSKPSYGIIRNPQLATYTERIGIGASEVFTATGGRFVINASGYLDAADGGDEALIGAVEYIGTSGSSNGDDEVAVQTSVDVWYELPATLNGTSRQTLTQALIEAYRFDNAEIKVISSVQYVSTAAPTGNTLIIMGGDVVENTLYVRLNPNELGQAGVV